MVQTNYTFPDRVARAGLPVDASTVLSHYKNSSLYEAGRDTWTVTVGGTATDGVYSFKVDGVLVAFTRGAAEANAAIAAALLAAGIADVDVSAENELSLDALVITVTHRQEGVALAITAATAPGSGTLVAANSVPVQLAVMPAGLALVRGANAKTCMQPNASSTALHIIGVSFIGEAALEGRSLDDAAGDVDGFLPSTMIPTSDHMDVWVIVEDAVSEGDAVFVRIDGTGVKGGFRSDVDGGDAIAWTAAKFASSAAAGEFVELRVRG